MKSWLIVLLCFLFIACGGESDPDVSSSSSSSTSSSSSSSSSSSASSSSASSSSSSSSSSSGDPLGGGYGAYCPTSATNLLDPEALSFQPVTSEPSFPNDGFAVMEGPMCIDGRLYVSFIGNGSDAPRGDILYLNDSDELQTFATDIGVNGFTLDSEGNIFGAVYGGSDPGRIGRFTFGATGIASDETVVSTYQGARFNSPNDLVVSSAGVVYFTDPNYHAPSPTPQAAERAYYLIGQDEAIAFGEEVTRPNGVMLAKDETFIYLGGQNGLFKYAINGDGSVADSGTRVANISSGVDGLSRDCEGNIYVSASGSVIVVSAIDDTELAQTSVASITNIAFCGGYIYATSLGFEPVLFRSNIPVSGLPF